MFSGWAQEHWLLLDGAAAALVSLQEGQQPELTTPEVEWSMDLLDRVVAAHWWRNVPVLGTWFKWVLDESKLLPSWNQLLEEALEERIPEGLKGKEPQDWLAGPGEGEGKGERSLEAPY